MTLVDLLTPTPKPERRWFILIQDYIIYALLFFSGTHGLLNNLWTDKMPHCVPILDCTVRPLAADCLNRTGDVVQDVSLVITSYISSICSRNNSLPAYLPYVDILLFMGIVVLWLCHNLWLKMPPYSRLALLYSRMDKTQRDQADSRLASNSRPPNSGQANDTQRLVNSSASGIELDMSGGTGSSRANSTYPFDNALNCLHSEEKSHCFKLYSFVQIFDVIGLVLCATIGGLLTAIYPELYSPFLCTLKKPLNMQVEFTSISCDLGHVLSMGVLYIVSKVGTFALCAIKFIQLLYYGCAGSKCNGGKAADLNVLRRMLAETHHETTKTHVQDIEGLDEWHQVAFLQLYDVKCGRVVCSDADRSATGALDIMPRGPPQQNEQSPPPSVLGAGNSEPA